MRLFGKRGLPLLLTMALFTGCVTNTAQSENGGAIITVAPAITLSTGSAAAAPESTLTDRDQDGSFDASAATAIALSDAGITVTGDGASALGSVVTIEDAGVYVLTGSLTNGRVVVAAKKTDKLQIVLSGVSVASLDGPALLVQQADKVFLTLAEGTESALSDGAAYASVDESGEPNACVFSKDDLTINGEGSLTVTGNFNHGIACKDDLVVTGGKLTVTAVNDGLKGRDSVTVESAEVAITAGGDGIQSNNDAEADKGTVTLRDSAISITATGDGVQAETVLTVTGGTLLVTTGGGSGNASVRSDGDWGRWGFNAQSSTAGETSAKGLKAGTQLQILSGTVTVDAADDAIHGNGDVLLAGGTVTLSSGDDGVHADADVTVSGGQIAVTESYEGVEGLTIHITGGVLEVTASDDGLNAAGGSDGSSVNGRRGQNMFASTDGALIEISGGSLTVNAAGDGLDSNGDLTVSGGTVLVSGPTNSGNGALDYNGTGVITGGVLVAAGASGMAESFGSASTQGSVLITYPATQRAGTRVALLDAAGNVLAEATPVKDYQSVVVSAPGMAVGSTVTLLSGNTELSSFTLSSDSSRVSSAGGAASDAAGGGFPGAMSGGGKGGGKGGRP